MSQRSAPSEQHFVGARRDLLEAVLDRIVPREGAFPGAGEAGVVRYLDSVAHRSDEAAMVLDRALDRLAAPAERDARWRARLSQVRALRQDAGR